MCRIRIRTTSALVSLASIVAPALPVAAQAREPGPPPLSADHSRAAVASEFGSGSFGRWLVDGFGLPAFRYDVDEQAAPRARQPELNGGTAAQHQLGNDHIVAAAFNDGYTQLWSQDRLAQWTNRFSPGRRHYAGGFGYLRLSGRVLSSLYLDRSRGAFTERRFGVGYYERRLRADGVEVREDVYAPFGDDPLLLHDVTIRNVARHAQRVSWFEYWDVNPYDQTSRRLVGLGVPRWTAAANTLVVPERGSDHPLSVFAAALQGPVRGHETSVGAFFGNGTRAAPAAVRADRLRGTTASAAPAGVGAGTLFAFRAPLRLRAGQSVTLRYAYGIAHRGQIGRLVRKYRLARRPFDTSERLWGQWLPRASFGPGNQWVARELEWDAYLLRAASVYEEACGHHTITQGGYYEYSSGQNLGSRSWLHYLLPMVYADPAMAREILRYSISLQSERSGAIPYGTVPPCKPYNGLGTSDDLDFWLLLAAAEYGLGSRDLAFFSERLPFSGHRPPGQRVAAPQGRLPTPRIAPRSTRRLPGRHQRRLVGLLRDLPAHERVDARSRLSSRTRIPGWRIWPISAATTYSQRSCAGARGSLSPCCGGRGRVGGTCAAIRVPAQSGAG